MRPVSLLAAAASLFAAGCSSLSLDRNMSEANTLSSPAVSAQAKPLRSDEERSEASREVGRLLQGELQADDAVRIAVAYSPAVQTVLFERAGESAEATQSARLPNPVFTFERLLRSEGGDVEKEIGRMLSVSVLDLVFLPARMRAADQRQQQLRWRLASDIVAAATEARQAWIRAVAAQQAAVYAEQVKAAAEAAADLARRMQAVGNFSRLQRAREQAFYADATAQLARAGQSSVAAREALVRVLGLSAEQAKILRLPDRLPDLPAAPRDATSAAQTALDERLDVRMSRAELQYLARQLGLSRVTSYVDGLHVAGIRNTETGKAPQRGFEVEAPLPIFDFGDARRAGAEATYMAAVNRAASVMGAASSSVREAHSAYAVAYGVARHYRDEIVPLRRTISDEMLLKYNGMLASVFELLADAREQIASVNQALEAQRDFWLADAALTSTLVGRPTTTSLTDVKPAGGAPSAQH